MAQRSRKPFALGLDPSAYNPLGLREYSTDVLMAEYARLRREATERLRKLGAGEFRESETYRRNKDKFKTVRSITSRRELERLTQEAAQFVTARGSSASGLRAIRREAIESLHRSGYTWVNTRNFRQFGEFMEYLRSNAAEYATFYESLRAGGRDMQRPLTRDERRSRKEMVEEWMEENAEE